MTAMELANLVISENSPIDWDWLKHLRNTSTTKELQDWARNNVEYFAPADCSKQLIGRAASIVRRTLF